MQKGRTFFLVYVTRSHNSREPSLGTRNTLYCAVKVRKIIQVLVNAKNMNNVVALYCTHKRNVHKACVGVGGVYTVLGQTLRSMIKYEFQNSLMYSVPRAPLKPKIGLLLAHVWQKGTKRVNDLPFFNKCAAAGRVTQVDRGTTPPPLPPKKSPSASHTIAATLYSALRT